MGVTKVGVGLAVFRSNPQTGIRQVLMGRRKGSHGEGQWSFPGGHMDHLESFTETAERELAEEVGEAFKVSNFRVVSIINLVEYDPKHYIDIGMECWWESGYPEVMEPDKCDGWQWFDIDYLPEPRFHTIDRILNSALVQEFDGLAVVWDSK